jgi:hypothetical protein
MGHVVEGSARRAAAVLLCVAALALVVAVLMESDDAGATVTGDAPPASGDWVVSHPTTVVDETVTVRGNVVVQSSLDLDGSTVYLAPASNASIGLAVTATGQLNSTDTRFASSTAFGYTFAALGRLNASTTVFEDCYRGVRVATEEDVIIRDCSIMYPLEAALVLEDANGTRVEGLHILAMDWHHQVTVSTVTKRADATEPVPVVAPGIVRVQGGHPSLAGLNVSFLRIVDVSVTLRYSHDPGAFLVELDCPVIEAVGTTSLNVSGVALHDALCEFRGQITAISGVAQGVRAVLGIMSQTTVLRATECPSIDIGDCSLVRVGCVPVLTIARSGNFRSFTQSTDILDPLILGFHVSATLAGDGPHSYAVALHDMTASRARLLRAMLYPDLPGNGWPVFGLGIAVDRVVLDGSNGTVSVAFEPASTGRKTLNAALVMTDCTFTHTIDSLILLDYLPGTAPDAYRSFILNDTTLLDRCTIADSMPMKNALVRARVVGGSNDLFERTLGLRNCTIRHNMGPLVAVQAQGPHTGGRERFLLTDCLLADNVETTYAPMVGPMPAWFMLQGWEEVTFERCTFRNNSVEEGIRIDAPGTGAEPSALTVRGCTFDRNHPIEARLRPPSFLNISWGGDLLLEDNDVVDCRMMLLNASEDPLSAHYSRLEVRGNHVRGQVGKLVLLWNTDANHTMLTVVIRDNLFEDCAGPIMDYPHYAYEALYLSWDARIDIINNTVRRCDGAVFWSYGDIHMRDNLFEDCTGLPVRLDNLRENQPVLENNTFVRCEDCIHIGGKAAFITRVLMFMNDTALDCTGTALSLFRAEANLTRVNVTGAATAITAQDAVADAYDSTIEPGSATIVEYGYVRVWFGLQVRVEWANATGVPSGNGVAGAMVSRFDRNGTFRGTEQADADGLTAIAWARQWSLEWLTGTWNYTLYSPYNVTASWSSFFDSVEVELNRSYVGKDTVLLLFKDLRPPLLVVTSPADGARLNVTDMLIEGYGEDAGSGLHEVSVSWGLGPWVLMPMAPTGEFSYTVPDFPEGDVDIVVRLNDLSGNDVWWTGNVFIDHTPPALAVLEPANGLLTNRTLVPLVAEFEPGARVWVDLQEFPGASGRLETLVLLNEGNNTITVRALDALDNEARVELRIVLDSIAPVLRVTVPTDGWTTNGTLVTVEGAVTGEDELTLTFGLVGEDGTTSPGSPDADGSFAWLVQVTTDGTYAIVVRAADHAGNAVAVRLTITVDTTAPDIAFIWPADGLITNVAQLTVTIMVGEDAEQAFLQGRWVLQRGTLTQSVLLVEGQNVLTLRALDRLGNERTVAVHVVLDTMPPVLSVTSPGADALRTNDPVVRMAGTVGDADTVLVNGLAVEFDATSGAFATDVLLSRDGIHAIRVLVTDRAGNNVSKLVSVELDRVPAPAIVSYSPQGPTITEGVGHVTVRVDTDGTAVRIEVVVSSGSRAKTYTMALTGGTSWSTLVTLERGGNDIVVRVLDVFGNLNVTSPYPIEFKPAEDESPVPGLDAFTLSVIIIAVGVAALVSALMLRRYFRRQPGHGP